VLTIDTDNSNQKQKGGQNQNLLKTAIKSVLHNLWHLTPAVVDLMLAHPAKLLWDGLIEVFLYYANA
jgi:hypothetical protein